MQGTTGEVVLYRTVVIVCNVYCKVHVICNKLKYKKAHSGQTADSGSKNTKNPKFLVLNFLHGMGSKPGLKRVLVGCRRPRERV